MARAAGPTRDRANAIVRRFDDLSRSQFAYLHNQLDLDRRALGGRLFAAATRPLLNYARKEAEKNDAAIAELDRRLA